MVLSKLAQTSISPSLRKPIPYPLYIVQANTQVCRYAPLGRAMLTGKLRSVADLPAGDLRLMIPRYQEGNFEQNLKLVQEVDKLAAKKGCTTGQIALGWLVGLSKRPDMPTIIPIPGTSEFMMEILVASLLTECARIGWTCPRECYSRRVDRRRDGAGRRYHRDA